MKYTFCSFFTRIKITHDYGLEPSGFQTALANIQAANMVPARPATLLESILFKQDLSWYTALNYQHPGAERGAQERRP